MRLTSAFLDGSQRFPDLIKSTPFIPSDYPNWSSPKPLVQSVSRGNMNEAFVNMMSGINGKPEGRDRKTSTDKKKRLRKSDKSFPGSRCIGSKEFCSERHGRRMGDSYSSEIISILHFYLYTLIFFCVRSSTYTSSRWTTLWKLRYPCSESSTNLLIARKIHRCTSLLSKRLSNRLLPSPPPS
jgi:hypothetical protein